jgi:hypothetical protein
MPGRDYWERVRRDLVPKVSGSAFAMLCVDMDADAVDVQFATQLGLSVMMDKPLIVVVRPGTKLPAHLVRAADEIVEMDPTDPRVEDTSSRLLAAINRVMARCS